MNLKEIEQEEDYYKRRQAYHRYVKDLLSKVDNDIGLAIRVVDDHEIKVSLLRLKELQETIRGLVGDVTMSEIEEAEE